MTTGEQPTRKRRREDEDDELSTVRRQMFDNSIARDNGRAHIGNSYNNFHGTVHQVVTSIPPLEGDKRNTSLRDALSFEEMELRRATIKLAHRNTCQWFFDSPEYRKWCDDSFLPQHHGFLWLRGKPGAGKSTLMKHAVRHADFEFSDCLRISFFFNAKGVELEKSIQGMYRSLLCQLLTQSPNLEKLLDKRTWTYRTWPIELLQELFYDAVLLLGEAKLICYIDALDECNTSEVRDMIEFLENLADKAVSANVQFRVFFASRHYPHINMPRCIHIILDNLKGHQQDIEAYLESTLKIPEDEIRHEIIEAVRKRAGDVFLWVVLVVRLLNEESDRGNPGRLIDRLREIPPGLHALFENALLERDIGDTKYLVPTLLWVLYGSNPITPRALYCAILHAGDSESTANCGPKPSFDQIEKFFLNESKGLVEVTAAGQNQRVQFIHETVREYLSSGGIGRLDHTFCHNPAGLGHETLRAMCFEYMSHAALSFQPSDYSPDIDPTYEAFYSRREQIRNKFPFLLHAQWESIDQAELAQNYGISQDSFVEAFPLDLVITCHNLLEVPELHYSASTSKVFVFANKGAPQLLELELSNHHGNANHTSRANRPTRSTSDGKTSLTSLHDTYANPLQAAASHSLDCTKVLLQYGANVNAKGSRFHTALHIAADHWKLEIVRILLEHGADVKKRTGPDWALHAAVHGIDAQLMSLVIKNGAGVDPRKISPGGAHGHTALSEAARTDIFERLAELGSDKRDYKDHKVHIPHETRRRMFTFLSQQGTRDDDV